MNITLDTKLSSSPVADTDRTTAYKATADSLQVGNSGYSLDITDKDILRKFILNENVKIIIFYTDKEDYKKKIINLIKIIG